LERLKLKVKSYAGHKADERPLEFQLGEQVYGVRAVLDRWYEPDCTYFKVKASDGNVYILKRLVGGVWTLESFRRDEVH
jgi:hypothetical protein